VVNGFRLLEFVLVLGMLVVCWLCFRVWCWIDELMLVCVVCRVLSWHCLVVVGICLLCIVSSSCCGFVCYVMLLRVALLLVLPVSCWGGWCVVVWVWLYVKCLRCWVGCICIGIIAGYLVG